MAKLEIEKDAAKEEINFLKEMLRPYTSAEERGVPERLLKADDLDRSKSNKEQEAKLMAFPIDRSSIAGPAGAYGSMQEADRIRRDTVIARLNHKRLMYGCLETAWRRLKKLEKDYG